jgi:hypothetical protein
LLFPKSHFLATGSAVKNVWVLCRRKNTSVDNFIIPTVG